MSTIRNRLGRTIFTGVLVTAMSAVSLPLFAVDVMPDATLRVAELSGNLPNLASQDFFTIEPAAKDSEVTLTLTFGSQDDGRIANNVNFRIFDQAGMRNLRDGAKPSVAAFGGGSPISGKDDDYKVSATFTVSGIQGYTVMVYSSAGAPANYTLRANNALLVDTSGKNLSSEITKLSSESMSQSPEKMADVTEATAETKVTQEAMAVQTNEPVMNEPLMNEIVSTNTSRLITAQNVGNGEHQYYTVKAISNDEEVTLTFDFTPTDNESLTSKFNFYVFSEETLRQLEAGARPEIVNLAAGNLKKVNETTLSATFRSVGNQVFTVIVANRSNVSATYTLSVAGADFQ